MKNFIRRSVSVILTAVLIFGVFVFHTSAVDGETSGITDGRIYYLINSNSGKALDVSAGNTADNSDVSQYTYTFGTYWQEWRIRYVGNGDYTVEDMHSRKLITNINDDARISSANGSDSQKFRIVRNSNGTYTFMSKSSGYTKSLGIYQSGTANGDTLRVLDNDSSANQKFTLRAEKTYGITDGFIYSLINVGDGQAVDIPGGATATGTYACKYTFSSMNPWQRFKVQLLDDGDCNLVDMNSGKLLSIVGSSANNGANAWIYDYDGTDGQKFRIQRTSDGTYTIYSKCSNYKMALGWNGVNLVQLAEDGSNNQKFRLVLAGCVYSIENVATGNCIDVSNGYTANGSDVAQYPYTGSRWQHWLIEYMQGETYRIIDMNSGKYLAIEGSSSANDANAWIWTWDNTNGEKFRIWYNGDDTVTFFTEAGTAGNMVLTLQGGAGSTATLVQQHHNGSDNQKFVLTPRATSAVPEGIYFFQNAELKNYMRIDNNESISTEGAKFELRKFDGADYQKWEIDYTADGYYRILSVASGKAVTAPPSGNDKNITQTVYTGGDNQWWSITVTDNGMYNLSPKSNPSYRMAASFGAFTPDGRNVELRDPRTDNKDEWNLCLLGEHTINLSIIYDQAYNNRYSDAYSRISDQVLVLQEKYLSEFGITVNNISLSPFSSYADTYCSSDYTHKCTHVDNASCENSVISNGNVNLKTYHHTNIFNIMLRIPFPDISSSVKMAYIGHDYCTEDNHNGNPYYGLTCTSIGLGAIMNFTSEESETKTFIHEFGHLYGVIDHYGGSAYSTEEIIDATGNAGYNKNCIYGENKESSSVLNDFTICDGCKFIIKSNIELYNH